MKKKIINFIVKNMFLIQILLFSLFPILIIQLIDISLIYTITENNLSIVLILYQLCFKGFLIIPLIYIIFYQRQTIEHMGSDYNPLKEKSKD